MSYTSEDLGILTGLGLIVAGVCGWILNVVKLCSADGMGGMEVARAVGIFVAPLGAVLGWF